MPNPESKNLEISIDIQEDLEILQTIQDKLKQKYNNTSEDQQNLRIRYLKKIRKIQQLIKNIELTIHDNK